jgi:putative flippase GtrA
MLSGPVALPVLLRLSRYGGVSTLCVLIHFGIMFLATGVLHRHYLIGQAASFVVLAPLGFALQRRWVFQARGARALWQFLRYLATLLVAFALNAMLMVGFVERAHLHPMAATLAVTFLNFLANFAMAHWVFARRHERASA